MIKARFTKEGVVFARYTYPGACVYPQGKVPYSEIESIDPNAFPPELRLHSGEVIFIPATHKEELEVIAANNGIEICSRINLWSGILEPFLDTEFDDEHTERTIQWLEENGVSREEVLVFRK
ncbi:hypothetical protein KKF84_06095 [Myxococcota bacterium]|nr:hypothetical protein [Myxococcota bacterium]